MTADVKIILDKWAKEKILDLKEFYMNKLVSNYNTSPLKATGKFGQSLAYSIDDKSLVIYTSVGYLSAMVDGTSPSEARGFSFDSLYRDLIEWATAKPVKVDNVKTFAYQAARSIREHGTTIYQLYGKKGQDTGLISKVFTEEEILEIMDEIGSSMIVTMETKIFAELW